MSETFYIHDMEIRFEYEPFASTRWICNVTLMKIRKRFSFIDEAHHFRTMCTYLNTTYPPDQVYRELLHKIARSGQMEKSEMAMYEEYFGTDDYVPKNLTIRERERFDAQKRKFEEEQKERARIVISKLGITFWGALIVEDIL